MTFAARVAIAFSRPNDACSKHQVLNVPLFICKTFLALSKWMARPSQVQGLQYRRGDYNSWHRSLWQHPLKQCGFTLPLTGALS